MARYRNAPQLRELEIPEFLLQRFATLQRTRRLTLGDYASFVSQLTPKQASYLNKGEPVEGFLEFDFEVDLSLLKGNIPALRFWARLNPNQKRYVLEGNRLSFIELSPEQKRLYMEAIASKHKTPLDGCYSIVSWARYFNTSTLSEVLVQSAFYTHHSVYEKVSEEYIIFYFDLNNNFVLDFTFPLVSAH